MQTAAVIFLAIVFVLFLLVALSRRGKRHKSSGGNAVNTDSELESHYSLLGDNSGRVKK